MIVGFIGFGAFNKAKAFVDESIKIRQEKKIAEQKRLEDFEQVTKVLSALESSNAMEIPQASLVYFARLFVPLINFVNLRYAAPRKNASKLAFSLGLLYLCRLLGKYNQ